jgi:hypothetical protein
MGQFSKLTKMSLLIQALGATVLLVGAWTSVVLYGLGFILLLPGSAVASFLPLRSIGSSRLLSLTGIDGPSYENLLYLPAAIAFNCVCVLLINKYLGKRFKSRH